MRATIPGLLLMTATLAGCPATSTETPAASSATATPKPVPSGLPIAPLRILPTRQEGSYRVDLPALHQVIALATAGELPLAATEGGYRVLRADEGSVLQQLGFRTDDVILTIANVSVLTPDLLVQLHPVWDHPQFRVSYRRGGQERAHTYLLGPPRLPLPPSRGEGGGQPEPFDQGAFAQGVKRAPDGVLELSRDALDMLLEDQSTVMRSARIVPKRRGDEIVGLQLRGIRRGSVLEVLGLENGDVVTKVAGYDVRSPDRALEAYEAIRNATEVEVEVLRDEAPLTLRYRVTKP